jgi:type IV fimbrial biogenesis protein FimT
MSVSSAALRQQGSSSGFTLVELLVTIAVVGIVTVVAVPSVQNLINANRLAASAEDLSAALQLARSEANRRNTVVTICATSNGTTCANTRAWNRWIILGRDTTAGRCQRWMSFAMPPSRHA